MTEPEAPEDLIHAEVERAVAPYVGVAPPAQLAKLREIAERYWRERPEAVRALRLAAYERRLRSGAEPTGDAPEALPDAAGRGRR